MTKNESIINKKMSKGYFINFGIKIVAYKGVPHNYYYE